jgi:hypothetical protein
VNGGLVLMHPTAPTLEALPGVIRAFRGRGLILTTVSDVLRLAPPTSSRVPVGFWPNLS